MLHIHHTNHSAIMPRQQSLFIRLSSQHVSVLCEGNALLLNADAGGIPLTYMGEFQK